MPSLQIRDMPEDVYEALAFRARLEHRSLAQQAVVELRRIPELLARERRMEVLDREFASLLRRMEIDLYCPVEKGV